ncbi:hypothetical protein ACHAWU_010196 [Discostella pseudostelligera]|uniref:Uncharacterized protein n=1 Tax=Discostella pseudostelligera TaxID=259834 RepID=A0ABD3MCG2_9STRA
MSGMFRGADKFNGDLSSWDISFVIDMASDIYTDSGCTFDGGGGGGREGVSYGKVTSVNKYEEEKKENIEDLTTNAN